MNPFCQIEFSEDDIFILFTSVLGAYGFEIALRGILLDAKKTGSWMWLAAPFVGHGIGRFCFVAVGAGHDNLQLEQSTKTSPALGS